MESFQQKNICKKRNGQMDKQEIKAWKFICQQKMQDKTKTKETDKVDQSRDL